MEKATERNIRVKCVIVKVRIQITNFLFWYTIHCFCKNGTVWALFYPQDPRQSYHQKMACSWPV